MIDFRRWRRIIKLDPARPLSDERLAEVCGWDVDAVVLGGSGGYGLKDVVGLLDRVRRHPLPVALEVSDPEAISPGFDLYLVPIVLNSLHVDWVIGHHQEAIKRYGDIMDWDKVVAEGYCILNPDAAAARLSRARTALGVDDVLAFARVAEHLLRLPIFYVEYSGTYGPPELVAAVRDMLSGTRLWYGGGISTTEQAREMEALADAVVVGNAIYEGHAPWSAR